MSEGLKHTPKEEISQIHNGETAGTDEATQKVERLQKETQELKEINDSTANLLVVLERAGEENAREILKQ